MVRALCSAVLLLSACGQSGDLYLPGEPAPASADEKKSDEEKKPDVEPAP